jgi:hypothetical protein
LIQIWIHNTASSGSISYPSLQLVYNNIKKNSRLKPLGSTTVLRHIDFWIVLSWIFLFLHPVCKIGTGVLRMKVVNKYIDEGIAELIPGVLFIDEVKSCLIFTK